MKKKFVTWLAGVAGAVALTAAPALAQDFASPELIAAAKAEGKLVLYTANFAEVEQEVIKEFNKRFPEIKVEMVRAPGGQLITRVKTEAAAGKRPRQADHPIRFGEAAAAQARLKSG